MSIFFSTIHVFILRTTWPMLHPPLEIGLNHPKPHMPCQTLRLSCPPFSWCLFHVSLQVRLHVTAYGILLFLFHALSPKTGPRIQSWFGFIKGERLCDYCTILLTYSACRWVWPVCLLVKYNSLVFQGGEKKRLFVEHVVGTWVGFTLRGLGDLGRCHPTGTWWGVLRSVIFVIFVFYHLIVGLTLLFVTEFLS